MQNFISQPLFFLNGLKFVYFFYEKIHVCSDKKYAIGGDKRSKNDVEENGKTCSVDAVKDEAKYY